MSDRACGSPRSHSGGSECNCDSSATPAAGPLVGAVYEEKTLRIMSEIWGFQTVPSFCKAAANHAFAAPEEAVEEEILRAVGF